MNWVVSFRHLAQKFLLRGEQPNVTLNFWYIISDFLRVIRYASLALYPFCLCFTNRQSLPPFPQFCLLLEKLYPTRCYPDMLQWWLPNLFRWLRTWTLGNSLWHKHSNDKTRLELLNRYLELIHALPHTRFIIYKWQQQLKVEENLWDWLGHALLINPLFPFENWKKIILVENYPIVSCTYQCFEP